VKRAAPQVSSFIYLSPPITVLIGGWQGYGQGAHLGRRRHYRGWRGAGECTAACLAGGCVESGNGRRAL